MGTVPQTSVTLLGEISSSAHSYRWAQFFRMYEEPMRGFLRSRFPSVDPEDAIQETMVALMRALPDYRYAPDEKGRFRCYLMGILAHKAQNLLRKDARLAKLRGDLRDESGNGLRMGAPAGPDSTSRYSPVRPPEEYSPDCGDGDWRSIVMEVAIGQLMADERIQPATKEVFRHVALMHEAPEAVAKAFGISRNNVDQIKNRMIARISAMVESMTADERHQTGP